MVWRAARIEALRLFTEPGLAAFLGLALLPAIAIVAGLPGGVPPSGGALDGPLHVSLLVNAALLAAGFGAVRTAVAFRAGIVGRDALVLRSGAGFWMRVVSSASGGAVVALGAWTFACVGVRIFGHLDVFGAPSLGAALMLGAGAGIWGAAIGALVRAPLAVLPLVILSLSPAMFLSVLFPDAVIALPLGSALLALDVPIIEAAGERWWSVGVAFLWLIGALCLSFAMYRERPLLS
ncbi:hypothetical protein ABS642_20105 [Microbacterium sp. A8/3-1]|uniref:ABC transporter permease n=1 Tax=Microbacterium sp. A8/3-1 TaxID=3160749 RepID=A0AAU7VWM7_9MICO